MAHIFISYAKKDTRALAQRLRDELGAIPDLTVWMDDSLEAGDSWATQIQDEIDRAQVVVVLLSPDVNRPVQPGQRRSFVLNEIDYAQAEHKPIIPVMAQTTRMPVQLAGVQYIDLSSDLETGWIKLKRQILHKASAPLRDETIEAITSPRSTSRRPLSIEMKVAIVGGGFILVAAVITGIFGLWQGVFSNPPGTTAEPTTSVAQNAIDTPTDAITPTETISLTPTSTSTFTPPPTLSQTEVEETVQAALQGVLAEFTQTAEVLQITESARIQAETATAAANLTATATLWTQTPTIDARGLAFARLTETQSAIERQGTQDVFASATEQAAARTATATLWTATPTVDARGTANARLTETQAALNDRATQDAIASATGFALDQTATATLWTATPTVDGTGTTSANFTATQAALNARATQDAIASATGFALDQTATATVWTQTPTIDATGTTSVNLTATQSILNDQVTQAAFASATNALIQTATAPPTVPIDDTAPFVTAITNANVRAGDSVDYPVVATLPNGQTATVLGISDSGSGWFYIELQGGQRGFISPTVATLTGSVAGLSRMVPPLTDDEARRRAALLLAQTGVTQNTDWIPFEQDFDGVTMVLVPKGCFMMGNSSGNSDEKPVIQQCIEPFWIDKYEVDNTQFAEFGGVADIEPTIKDNQLPRISIDWNEAVNFCFKREMRLPTESEWEFAARGPDSLLYPWGNEFNGEFVVYSGNSDGRPQPPGSRIGNKSWVGAYDLSGNVLEWVSSIYLPYPYDPRRADIIGDSDEENVRVQRGGSWANGNTTTTNRFRAEAFSTGGQTGFRCVRSLDAE